MCPSRQHKLCTNTHQEFLYSQNIKNHSIRRHAHLRAKPTIPFTPKGPASSRDGTLPRAIHIIQFNTPRTTYITYATRRKDPTDV